MEIPVINRISNFESSISSLHSPSFLSQFLSVSGIDRIPRASSFWKWSALILAILASFSAIINRIKILIIRFQKEASSAASNPLLRPPLYDGDSDGSCSSSDSDEDEYDYNDEDDEASEEVKSATDNRRRGDEIFSVKGIENLRRPRSIGEQLSEFASGKSVVKLWENIGLGLGFEVQGEPFSGNFVSTSSSSPPPAVIVTAARASCPLASVLLWDTRAASKKPAILAAWGPQVGSVDAIGYGGLAKLYLRAGGELAAVGDLRRVSTPLDNATESDMETWWDADAVFVGGAGSSRNGGDSAVTRCCDAVRPYLFF